MGKRRVMLRGAGNQFVTIDDEATLGAILGETLYWPDGKLVTVEDFQSDIDTREIDTKILTTEREATAAIADNRKIMLMGF